MPPKKVLQYQCDRCPSVWYADENKPEPPCTVEVKASFGDGAPLLAKFECLCPSCRKTVQTLITQISRTLQKVSSIRVAKKKGEGEKSVDKAPASSTESAKPTAPAAASAAAEVSIPSRQSQPSPVAPQHAAAVSSGKPPQVIADHPKR